MKNKELEKKVNRAIKLLQAAGKVAKEHGQPLEVAYSGGKDSDVILELTRMAGVEYRAIYKNTTIDPSGTIKHAQEMGAEMVRPKKSFRDLISSKGFPTRIRRFCCSYLKEYKVLDYCVIGVRREESRKRAERYHEPEVCRVYSKTQKQRQYLPILEWTSEDVSEFVAEREIKCHPLYYDEQGMFHPERRLGCMCCPLISRKSRLAEFKANPRMIRFYIGCGKKFLETHKDSSNQKHFRDVYEWLTFYLFCDSLAEFKERFGTNLFNDGVDCKEFLENYFNIEL